MEHCSDSPSGRRRYRRLADERADEVKALTSSGRKGTVQARFLRWQKSFRPDALLVADYYSLQLIEDSGLKIPEKVSVIFLNAPEPDGWAHINQHHDLVGAAAVDLVVGQLHRNERGSRPIPKQVFLPGSFVHGPTLTARGNPA